MTLEATTAKEKDLVAKLRNFQSLVPDMKNFLSPVLDFDSLLTAQPFFDISQI